MDTTVQNFFDSRRFFAATRRFRFDLAIIEGFRAFCLVK